MWSAATAPRRAARSFAEGCAVPPAPSAPPSAAPRPLTLDELRQIMTELPIVRRDTPRRIVERDRLVLGLGWAAALRAGELVDLDAEDLTFDGPPCDPTAAMTVYLHRSKTAQQGHGDFVIVHYSSNPAACPTSLALHAVCENRSGPLFRHIDRHGTAHGGLAAAAVSRIVKRAVTDILRRDATPTPRTACAPD
jgi:hypothetical protein